MRTIGGRAAGRSSVLLTAVGLLVLVLLGVAPAATSAAPVLRNVRPPAISVSADDTALYCDPGTWTVSAVSYGYQWRRDGSAVSGPSGSTYPLTTADDGHALVCHVTAASSDETGTADSAAYVAGAPTRPVDVTPPSIVGTARRGSTLGCATGTWSGTPAPTYAFQWLRGGVPVADTPSYLVVAADVGRSLSCTVTAANAAGAAAASSASVVPADGTDPAPPACAGTPGVVIAGGAGAVRDPAVTLTLAAPADATALEIANAPDFAGAVSRAPSATCRYSWTLQPPSTDAGLASVYVRWVGGASAGQVVTDSVRFDRAGPVLTGATVRFHHRRWVLKVGGSDPSGIVKVQYAARPSGGTVVAIGAQGVQVPSPRAAAFVRAFDSLGNVGPWLRSG